MKAILRLMDHESQSIAWIAYIVFAPFKFWRALRRKLDSYASSSYDTNIQILIRIIIFSALQLTPIMWVNCSWTLFALLFDRLGTLVVH